MLLLTLLLRVNLEQTVVPVHHDAPGERYLHCAAEFRSMFPADVRELSAEEENRTLGVEAEARRLVIEAELRRMS